MNPGKKIYVAGHRGMVGAAIMRELSRKGYQHIVARTHDELDLTRQRDVEKFFEEEKPDYVFVAAAKVGGILANDSYPADFIQENLAIQTHVISAAFRCGVERLLFLGSSCIYPKACPQPMKEEHLLTGTLEPTNAPYAIAKIAGIKMCEAYNRQYGTKFLCAMPTNLYGPGDNFDLQTSHVLPALIRKFNDGKKKAQPVTLWGTGQAQRELLYVDDCAEACVFLMNLPGPSFQTLLEHEPGPLINVGWGQGLTVAELAQKVKNIVGFEGTVQWDATKPDGTMKKVLDVSRINALGWKPHVALDDGVQRTFDWYRESFGREAVVGAS